MDGPANDDNDNDLVVTVLYTVVKRVRQESTIEVDGREGRMDGRNQQKYHRL